MEPPHKVNTHHDDARVLTAELRTSDKPRWDAIRDHLAEAGYDPQRSAVGDLFPEDVGYFGVLVAPDRTTHTFMVGKNQRRGWWVSHDERTTARERFSYAPAMFAAMTLLEAEDPTDARPLDLLVDYLAILNKVFRGLNEERWDPRRPENYWHVLYGYMRDRSIDPMRSVALHWVWTLSDPEIDGGLLDPSGRCYHFAGPLDTMHGPINQVTTWDELALSEAYSIYYENVDAGLELLRREGQATT